MTAERMRIAIACSPAPGEAVEVTLDLEAGTTVLDAIRASGLLERYAALDLSTQTVGIWGRACALDATLREGDRVEIYRGLAIDPKEARRRRVRADRGSTGA